jgi:hypothetical protein
MQIFSLTITNKVAIKMRNYVYFYDLATKAMFTTNFVYDASNQELFYAFKHRTVDKIFAPLIEGKFKFLDPTSGSLVQTIVGPTMTSGSFCKGNDFHPSRDIYVIYCFSPSKFIIINGSSNTIITNVSGSYGWFNYLKFISTTGIMVVNLGAKYQYYQLTAGNAITFIESKFSPLGSYESLRVDDASHIMYSQGSMIIGHH